MEVPRHWRTQKARYSLEGIRCTSCEVVAFPPRDLCPDCGSTSVQPQRLSGRGAVYSYSTVFAGPNGFAEFSPYVSPDGKYLFFMAARTGPAEPLPATLTADYLRDIHAGPQNGGVNIYWIDAGFLEELRPGS